MKITLKTFREFRNFYPHYRGGYITLFDSVKIEIPDVIFINGEKFESPAMRSLAGAVEARSMEFLDSGFSVKWRALTPTELMGDEYRIVRDVNKDFGCLNEVICMENAEVVKFMFGAETHRYNIEDFCKNHKTLNGKWLMVPVFEVN